MFDHFHFVFKDTVLVRFETIPIFFNQWLYCDTSCIKQNEEYSVKQKRNQNEPYDFPSVSIRRFIRYPMRGKLF